MQPRILYPKRPLFTIEGEIKIFQDRQKLKKYVTTKGALQEILRWTLKKKRKSKETIHKNRDWRSITVTVNS